MAAFMRFLALFTGILHVFLWPFYGFFAYLISGRAGSSTIYARPNSWPYKGY